MYILTKLFPNDERLGLIDQLQRAAVSIPSNIAEGSGRKSFKDQAHFVAIAYGSLMEGRQLQSYRRYLIKQLEEPA